MRNEFYVYVYVQFWVECIWFHLSIHISFHLEERLDAVKSSTLKCAPRENRLRFIYPFYYYFSELKILCFSKLKMLNLSFDLWMWIFLISENVL